MRGLDKRVDAFRHGCRPQRHNQRVWWRAIGEAAKVARGWGLWEEVTFIETNEMQPQGKMWGNSVTGGGNCKDEGLEVGTGLS